MCCPLCGALCALSRPDIFAAFVLVLSADLCRLVCCVRYVYGIDLLRCAFTELFPVRLRFVSLYRLRDMYCGAILLIPCPPISLLHVRSDYADTDHSSFSDNSSSVKLSDFFKPEDPKTSRHHVQVQCLVLTLLVDTLLYMLTL
jgi:hypothetical protein